MQTVGTAPHLPAAPNLSHFLQATPQGHAGRANRANAPDPLRLPVTTPFITMIVFHSLTNVAAVPAWCRHRMRFTGKQRQPQPFHDPVTEPGEAPSRSRLPRDAGQEGRGSAARRGLAPRHLPGGHIRRFTKGWRWLDSPWIHRRCHPAPQSGH